MKLYEITNAYKQLEQLLEDQDADQNEVGTFLVECKDALEEKAVNVAKLIQNIEATAEAIKAAEGRMAERRKALEGRAKHIKDYLLANMQNAQISKIECEYFTLTVRNNPQRVVIDDESLIPLQYLRQPEPPPPAPDKKQILADIKQGCVVDGCHIEQGQSLVIK